MSHPRTPNDEELELAEAIFGMFSLFKQITFDAAQTTDVGSPERARILWTLKGGPVRAGGLATLARLSPSAITETVEGLERDGLVRRETDPADRRAVRVALTADGKRQLQRFEAGCASALADRLAPLTTAQRQRIKAAMNELRDILRNSFTSTSQPEVTLRTAKHKEALHVR